MHEKRCRILTLISTVLRRMEVFRGATLPFSFLPHFRIGTNFYWKECKFLPIKVDPDGKFLPLREDPTLEGVPYPRKQTKSHKSWFWLVKMGENIAVYPKTLTRSHFSLLAAHLSNFKIP